MANSALERLEQFAIDVILERRYGKRATLLRWFLWGLSKIYAKLMRLRWWMYEKHYFPSYATGCMVISVGNMTVGGTGKTPVVEKIVRALQKAGRKVAILSRGYKSVPAPWWKRTWRKLVRHENPPRVVSDGKNMLLDSEKAGDEPYMLASNLKDVVVLVDKDRVKSARYAIEKFGVDTLVLDDGYQYLPLKERLNLVLVDRHAPFGNEFLLPRGTLREPKDHLKRGDVIFITKSDGTDLSEIKSRLKNYNRHAEIIECSHRALYLQDLYTDERVPLDYLKARKIGAICGIAVPESFENALKAIGAELIYARSYADHHRFSNQEVLNAINRTRARGGHALITTEKDAVRLPRVHRTDLPVYFLRVEIELRNAQESFEECVLRICGLKEKQAA